MLCHIHRLRNQSRCLGWYSNRHTISNLCISGAVGYDKEYSFGASHQGTIGLFGYCLNASISDIRIDNASFLLNDLSGASLYAGGAVGYAKPADENAGFSVPCYELYDLPEYAIYSETDCVGCDSLPESCGFDPAIWKLSDPEHPDISHGAILQSIIS